VPALSHRLGTCAGSEGRYFSARDETSSPVLMKRSVDEFSAPEMDVLALIEDEIS